MNENSLHVITEVGVFGDLNIKDPTKKKVKKDKTELEVLIAESIEKNNTVLTENV